MNKRCLKGSAQTRALTHALIAQKVMPSSKLNFVESITVRDLDFVKLYWSYYDETRGFAITESPYNVTVNMVSIFIEVSDRYLHLLVTEYNGRVVAGYGIMGTEIYMFCSENYPAQAKRAVKTFAELFTPYKGDDVIEIFNLSNRCVFIENEEDKSKMREIYSKCWEMIL